MILIMYVTVDALRLTGTTHNAFYVHVMPVLTIVVTPGGMPPLVSAQAGVRMMGPLCL